jgi:hypothetical protein
LRAHAAKPISLGRIVGGVAGGITAHNVASEAWRAAKQGTIDADIGASALSLRQMSQERLLSASRRRSACLLTAAKKRTSREVAEGPHTQAVMAALPRRPRLLRSLSLLVDQRIGGASDVTLV